MDNTVTLLIIIGLLGGSAFILGIGIFFLQGYFFADLTPIQDRLNSLKRKQSELDQEIANASVSNARLLKGSQFANEELGKIFSKFSITPKIQRALQQAGIKMPVDQFIVKFLIFPTLLGVVGFILLKMFLLILVGPVFFMVAYMIVRIQQQKRLAKLTTQLPDSLNLITSSLRAGHSFQSAMTIVVNELPDPISTEFGQVVSDINWGIPVKDALTKMSHHLDTLSDIRMFVTSLIIQRETGGNLAEILDKLSYTIRERFKLQGQIKALTGQARLTGYFLGCAPTGLFVFLYFFMNSYIAPLLNADLGKLLLICAAGGQIIGFVVMKKIIEIRV